MTIPANSAPSVPSDPSVEVYAVYGVEPEIQAYAMAKYSRSALSMKESLKEITQQKAEKFLNTFYFQYGHRSIADLAHIALAIEKLSILAAIAVADEQRWDGQERSTRYQDFKQARYFTPNFGEGREEARDLYRKTMEGLFAEYEALSGRVFRFLTASTPKPEEMKQEAYERTLRARAFDFSRYLLPLAVNTSLGEIVNARSAASGRAAEERRQVARLQRESGIARGTGRCDSRDFAATGRPRCRGTAARSAGCADPGEVCRPECLRDGDPSRTAAGGV
jgi:hypothetical protein